MHNVSVSVLFKILLIRRTVIPESCLHKVSEVSSSYLGIIPTI